MWFLTTNIYFSYLKIIISFNEYLSSTYCEFTWWTATKLVSTLMEKAICWGKPGVNQTNIPRYTKHITMSTALLPQTTIRKWTKYIKQLISDIVQQREPNWFLKERKKWCRPYSCPITAWREFLGHSMQGGQNQEELGSLTELRRWRLEFLEEEVARICEAKYY